MIDGIDDNCPYWEVFVNNVGNCIEYCKKTGKPFKHHNCVDCQLRDKTKQSTLGM